MSLRIGFFGAGFIARFHLGLLQGSAADHTVSSVYDPDHGRAEAFARDAGAVAAADEEEVLATSDAVYVCTWTSEHRRLVEVAARRGLAVFCEKPLAFDAATAQRMTEAVERAAVTNQVGLVLRSLPSFRLLREMMANPDNGALMSMVLRDDQFIPVQGQYGSDWRADKERSGAGALLEHSIHDLDILEWLAGPVVSIDARSASHHGLDGIEDVVVASMAFESGALASLTSVWHDVLSRPSLRRLEVFFERAWFSLEHELTGPLRWQRADGEDGGLEGAELSRAADEVGAGWDDPAARFVHAAAAGEPTWPDFRTALRAHVLTDAAYRSAASGGAPQPV